MSKVFVISPVRNITPEFAAGVSAFVEQLEHDGNTVHWPQRDTKQDALELSICWVNKDAIKQADVVYFAWDGKSQGCLFDLGMAFALGKYVRPAIGLLPRSTHHEKSFQNFVHQYEDVMSYFLFLNPETDEHNDEV